MKELKVNYLKTRLGLLVTTSILYVIFYLSFGSKKWPFTATDYILLAAYILLTIFSLIIVKYTFSISYDNTAIYITRFGKTNGYKFNDVLYIDEPYTEKHKALTYYRKDGKLVFIALDKEKQMLNVFKDNCKNTISREQFISRYPNTKL